MKETEIQSYDCNDINNYSPWIHKDFAPTKELVLLFWFLQRAFLLEVLKRIYIVFNAPVFSLVYRFVISGMRMQVLNYLKF